MLAGNRNLFTFPLRASRRATVRDVVVVALWIAFASVFVVDLWRSETAPAPGAGVPAEELVDVG